MSSFQGEGFHCSDTSQFEYEDSCTPINRSYEGREHCNSGWNTGVYVCVCVCVHVPLCVYVCVASLLTNRVHSDISMN